MTIPTPPCIAALWTALTHLGPLQRLSRASTCGQSPQLGYRLLWISALLAPTLAIAETPWLPEPGRGQATISHIDERYDEFYSASGVRLFPTDVVQKTQQLTLEYGLYDAVSVSLQTGYTRGEFDVAPQRVLSGRDDSQLNIKWRWLDEDTTAPLSLTWIASWIIEGSYATSFPGHPHSPGDGTSGAALTLALGKRWQSGWSVSGSLGYQARNSGTPKEILVAAQCDYSWSRSGVGIRYLREQALSGLDIGNPELTPFTLHRLREITDTLDVNAWWRIHNNWFIAADYAQVIEGRNTGKKQIYALSLGYSF